MTHKSDDNDAAPKTALAMNNDGEAFTIFYRGRPLQIHWKGVPPLSRSPALRLCNVGAPPESQSSDHDANWLLLLTADKSLYSGRLQAKGTALELELLRPGEVFDVDFCPGSQELFVVASDGSVQRQRIVNNTCRPGAWQTLSFDPLELCAEGVCIRRVCCSAHGVVFVSSTGETYVLGSCGDVFNSEAEPRHMRLYEEDKELLDLMAGDEHFVLLVGAPYDTADDVLQLQRTKEEKESHFNLTMPSASANTSLEQPQAIGMDRASVKSLSSATDSSQTDRSYASNTRFLLHQGYSLLHTQVYTFGASNNGLLGTGDHIKRASIARVQKLDGWGVCSIAAGREHTVARTLDGRLYHWGLNSRGQLGGSWEDLSAPTEITIGEQAKLPKEEQNALEACCGDFQTILLKSSGQMQTIPLSQQSTYVQTLIHLQLGTAWPRQLRLLLSAGAFTLQNSRKFQGQYHYYLSHLQSQLQLLLKYRASVQTLQIWQRQSSAPALNTLETLLVNWERIVCLLASTLHSLEGFYRADYEQAADLVFICYHREFIDLFEGYTKSYCDIYSVDGFGDAVKAIATLISPQAELNEENYLTSLFQQPFNIYPVYLQFIEALVKTQPEYNEHRLAWIEFARSCCISRELAVNTKEFWSTNERNARIRPFRRQASRVILTSFMVPLKLSTSSLIINNPSFILFSDNLLQVSGSSLHTYPLGTVWVRPESDLGLRIITPEKTFTLTTRSHENRKVWLDQLQATIVAHLGRPLGSTAPSIRSTGYQFSREHPKYSNAKACGTWRKGVLHGNCYLEYPDGSVYCGEVQHGIIEGFGKMVIPASGMYVGHFKGGRFHGHGVYEMCGNEVYEGYFCEGLFHGHGMLRNNRYIYVGEYQANTRSGYGVLEDLVTGDKYMGMFADNKKAGPGVCITSKGDYFEGVFTGDELQGNGFAVFENDYYYEGDLTLNGPNGKGEYFMPSESILKLDDSIAPADNDIDECFSCELIGNKMFGHLSGTWQNVRIQTGELALNRRFPKYPQLIGTYVVDNNRKWRSLFSNFETEIFSCTSEKLTNRQSQSTSQLWSCISVYMSRSRAREFAESQRNETITQTSGNHFERNILLDFTNGSFENIPQKLTPAKNHPLEVLSSPPRRIHSQEMLYNKDSLPRTDSLLSMGHHREGSGGTASDLDTVSYASFQEQNLLSSSFNGSNTSIPINNNNSSKHINKNNSNRSVSSGASVVVSRSSGLDVVPSFGMASTLSESDVTSIMTYLEQAFKDRHHPLFALNERIGNCFHYSYGCWKVKPKAILAKRAMQEWESISKRIYRFVRKMFPALPENYCQVEGSQEVISHITLLYPFVLSEGIYSTLFVLYANKYSRKDEIYRHNLNYVEKLSNSELIELLGIENSLNAVMLNDHFDEAIKMLKQLQEKFSPKDMLTVIQESMALLTEAHKSTTTSAAISIPLSADSMMPLTLLNMLRAAVPHLGAELALLDDLTGDANFTAEMNGLAGYCYTTLKAAYEHVTSKPLQRTN